MPRGFNRATLFGQKKQPPKVALTAGLGFVERRGLQRPLSSLSLNPPPLPHLPALPAPPHPASATWRLGKHSWRWTLRLLTSCRTTFWGAPRGSFWFPGETDLGEGSVSGTLGPLSHQPVCFPLPHFLLVQGWFPLTCTMTMGDGPGLENPIANDP